jgi:hypothetical protein
VSKRNHSIKNGLGTNRLSWEAFVAITAVEVLALTDSARKRFADMKARQLSPDRCRAEVLKAYANLAKTHIES